MLSNDYYSYDRRPSDSSDSSQQSVETINYCKQLLTESDQNNNRYDNSDHNYNQNKSILELFSQFGGQIEIESMSSEPMEPLFSVDLPFDDSDVDFANAPTPFMNSVSHDLDDIESDDLMTDLDFTQQEKPLFTDSSPIATQMGFDIIQNEVEIDGQNEGQPINQFNTWIEDSYESHQESQQTNNDMTQDLRLYPSQQMTRKRFISEIEDQESEEEDQSVSEFEFKRKSKVGRKPSKGENKCMSRNAIAARENREKKKAYVQNMEKRLRVSQEDNQRLTTLNNTLIKTNEGLIKEVQYLKGVLNNDSSIAQLIKDLSNSRKIELIGTQFVESKDRLEDNCLDSKTTQKIGRKSSRIAAKGDIGLKGESSGVCLHINKKTVSLELCPKCSQKHNKKGK